MMIEEGTTVRFQVFGSEKVFKTPARDGEKLLEILDRLGLFPDDYIITYQGSPLPIDSVPEHDDYVIYKVPSGG